MKTQIKTKKNEFDVIVVGAGPAGLGVGIVLKQLGIDHVILDKNAIGSSFRNWPKETHFISPSFTGNFFKMPDLNAICPDSSPAFSLLTEHPSGEGYAKYLEAISEAYELPIQTGVEVQTVSKEKKQFILETSNGKFTSKFVIWAAGEFQYPRKNSFKGSEYCLHYSQIDSFAKLKGKERIIIGAYESGFDSAYNLIKAKKKVTLLDRSENLKLVMSDSSYSLSPFTRDRIKEVKEKMLYHSKTKVKKVEHTQGKYVVTSTKNKTFTSKYKPIDCTGFTGSLTLVKEHFEFEGDYPLLTDNDESTLTKNLFLVGPKVKHNKALFCFIYKFRQRFAIVAERIARRNKVSTKLIQEVLHEYKENNFYLKDLSCCDNECVC